MGNGGSFLAVKRPGREANHSPLMPRLRAEPYLQPPYTPSWRTAGQLYLFTTQFQRLTASLITYKYRQPLRIPYGGVKHWRRISKSINRSVAVNYLTYNCVCTAPSSLPFLISDIHSTRVALSELLNYIPSGPILGTSGWFIQYNMTVTWGIASGTIHC